MINLLDVNVLVALFDPMHACHEAAHDWFSRNREPGWATCPMTENGFVRVISHLGYPGRRTSVPDAIHRLEVFRQGGGHSFWADTISLRDRGSVLPVHIHGSTQLTDVYLLALAVKNSGRLATFDRKLRPLAVIGAKSEHIEQIPPP